MTGAGFGVRMGNITTDTAELQEGGIAGRHLNGSGTPGPGRR